ncbi:MAG: type I restriction enzyme HsdR N-terminal domain-containing protein [Sphingobacteriales bacterium]|nr:MAG: type I restriction enzyme HsdR N-terminal domain-containing protein [Sphingobacteriales bacterium]
MFAPIPLNLPPYPFKLTKIGDELFVLDALRKKKLLLTPEEWVRQHFVQFLILDKKYPKSLIKLEGGLKINTLKNRTDILVFDKQGLPFILVECKATSIKINQKVFDQAARYNTFYNVQYLVVTNGLVHYYCEMDYQKKSYTFLNELPICSF